MVLARASKERAHDPSDPYRAVPDEQALVSRPPQLETLIGPWQAFHFARTLAYHARTIYLFTCDNIQIIVLPWTAAGIADALAGSALTTNYAPRLQAITFRIPHSLLWMWLNILAFTISNQRSPSSAREDCVNKPWRPIPSGRLSTLQAEHLLLALVPLVLIITTWLGAGSISAVALVLNWMYNDLGGSEVHYTVRNLINALAMVVASTGTTRVAMYDRSNLHDFTSIGYQWLAIKAAIVFTTLQIQDLRDQDGDRSRGRNTAPIALGDEFTRWTISGPVIFWSMFCPFFWDVDFLGYVMPITVGCVLSLKVLFWRGVEADQFSWTLWGIWTFSIFLLPLYRSSVSSYT